MEIFKKPNCYVFKKWNSNHGILYSAEEDGNGEVLLNIIITKSPGAFNVWSYDILMAYFAIFSKRDLDFNGLSQTQKERVPIAS